ncbi:phage tail assembly chaperone [Pseudomonas fluorescens]|uniref:phage tail assembly chaperone n=1 Tax=Pseudomonas fluorescens TaxID=294 RepID=UPI001BE68143|nr:hypothetical protein [Pseudomonas fluorescens]
MTLKAEQYGALQAYRQALRDWLSTVGFPDPQSRPERPSWLALSLAPNSTYN